MLRRTRRFTPILVLSAATLVTGGLAPAVVGVEAAQAASTKPSLDLCVVEPGFATPGDSFALTTTGPKNFNDTATPADQANGTVDLTSMSATVKATGPTACLFAELPGGSGGGFSGGSGSSGKSGTTTTTKPGTTVKPPIVQSFCALHPAVCTFKSTKVGP